MLMEVQGFDVPDEVDEAPYDDVDVDTWYAGYVTTAKEKGLLEETGDMLSPGDDMTRASISEMTYRAIIVNEEGLDSFGDYLNDEEEVVEENLSSN